MEIKTLWSKFVKHSRRPYYQLMRQGFKVDVKNSIFLFTIGRGGGTWLLETVAESNDMFQIFEPISGEPGYHKIFQNGIEFFEKTTEKNWPIFKSYLDESFEGKALRNHHFYFNSLELPGRKKAVMKFVNKNLLLPFFVKEYDLSFPVCVLIRNPFEIIRSRKNYQQKSDFSKEAPHNFTVEELVDRFDYFDKYHGMLNKIKTNYEYEVFKICNEWAYLIGLEEIKDKVVFVSFEDLKSGDEDRLKHFLSVYKISEIKRKKSASSRKVIGAGIQKDLDSELKNRLQNIVQEFEELKEFLER